MSQRTLDDVVAAGRVLFGPAFRADGQAWRVDLKTTYRRRALETHPDRARAVGRTEAELAREFRRVAEAYQVLAQLTAGSSGPGPGASAGAAGEPRPPARAQGARPAARQAPRSPPQAASEQRPAPPPPGPAPGQGRPPVHRTDARARAGVSPEAMPRRRLRFAEYLYYSGRVPWTVMVESIAWQRRQRPPVGRIAVDWGFLDPEDVGRIMEERRARSAQTVPFGEFAVRLGYLTSFQLLAVLGRQLRQQRRIGEYFVQGGFIDPGELDDLRHRIHRHNARWPG